MQTAEYFSKSLSCSNWVCLIEEKMSREDNEQYGKLSEKKADRVEALKWMDLVVLGKISDYSCVIQASWSPWRVSWDQMACEMAKWHHTGERVSAPS